MVAAASQTRVRRFPGRDGCGTRMHTIPAAFATSIARARNDQIDYALADEPGRWGDGHQYTWPSKKPSPIIVSLRWVS